MLADKEFEQFLRQQSSGSTPFFIMVTVREKLAGIENLYKTTAEALSSSAAKENAPFKKRLEAFMDQLIEKANLTIEQFDWLISDFLEDDEEEDDETNDGDFK